MNIDGISKIIKNLNLPPNLAPKAEFISLKPELKTQEDILAFLKESGIKQFELAELQSKNADKQFVNNRKLTILALIFAFISIVPVLREYIPIFAPKNNDRDIYELKNKVLSLSNTNLENQVKILKVENELLKAKKTSEKEKKKP
jgi:hypothetical protein